MILSRAILPAILLLLSSQSIARCRFPSIEEEFKASTAVYTATIVRADFLSEDVVTELNPDSDDGQPVRSSITRNYRFELRVERVYKGVVEKRVEVFEADEVLTVVEHELSLLRFPVGTEVLLFWPSWDGGCGNSGSVEYETKSTLEILENLKRGQP